ncbi:MAG: response regulator transcription factor [Ekhidna sp.]|nr:response regulator transcription factor [Ekhidna sp.]MBC6410817.1 response regulator transcription factor [Ekhidna sp.]MBC6426780.1 response regulator transcription factor [Ekhidna sp.]
MTTRVFLADFQFLTRKGMSALIKSIPGFEMSLEIDDVQGLQSEIKKSTPDLIVLDLDGKEKELVPQIEEIKRKEKNTSFLVISNIQSRESIKRLLNAGIKGILTKNCSEEEITNGLIAVSKGRRFFCNTILELVIQGETEEKDCEPTDLSAREFEVLALITKGMTTAAIADQLYLSVHTINSHRKNMLKKLGLSSPTELVVYALESGLIKK